MSMCTTLDGPTQNGLVCILFRSSADITKTDRQSNKYVSFKNHVPVQSVYCVKDVENFEYI